MERTGRPRRGTAVHFPPLALFAPFALLALLAGVVVEGGPMSGVGLAGASPASQATPQAAAQAVGTVVSVVAAENFWGSIASQIGGRHARVTSLITSPTADPHLFATNARDAATLAGAQVVVENGAGYDSWMDSLLGADGGSPRIVNAATVLHVHGADPNPHLWYDLPRVPTVAAAIAAALSKADPSDRALFRANLTVFDASLAPLEATLGSITHRFHGVSVAYTERVPGYLLADARLDVKTPAGFARAIEDGVDPSAADTLAMRQLLTDHDVNVLLYNVQTVTPVTAQMRALARQHGIPVVGVSETMPTSARTFQRWQLAQLTALLRALGGSRSP
jgi:zinc/manganese transport system substrate-binding protein